jgi:hypothetical protein
MINLADRLSCIGVRHDEQTSYLHWAAAQLLHDYGCSGGVDTAWTAPPSSGHSVWHAAVRRRGHHRHHPCRTLRWRLLQ